VPVSGTDDLLYCYATTNTNITSVDAPWTQVRIDASGAGVGYIVGASSNTALAMTNNGNVPYASVGMSFKYSAASGSSRTPTVGSATVTGTQSVVGRGIITRSMIQGT
jgi:hypothetical protein